MHVGAVVTAAAMSWGASRGVCAVRLDDVLVDMVSMWMMKVPVMQVVDVTAVTDSRVTAVRPVLMLVSGVCCVGAARQNRSP